ncbi:MAG: DUF4177 domain-containing protein [Saprospiraceae bacterium]|nr:DUF4177 domain-containing protein [Saprospiraceae bacterium]
MDKFEYKVVSIKRSIWTGKSKHDYLEVINEYGADGWRFVCFADRGAAKKGVATTELIFEKKY